MKKRFISIFLVCCITLLSLPATTLAVSTNNLTLYGDAKQLASGEIELTELATWRSGSAWWGNMVNTTSGFVTGFSYWAGGGRDDSYGGADGIILTFSEQQGLGADGEYLGFVENNSYGVELDSYPYNSGDPSEKHIGIVHHSTHEHLATVSDDRVDDSSWHNIMISYYSGVLNVYLDGDAVLSSDNVHLPDSVYLGISASTGGGLNRHLIKDFYFEATDHSSLTNFEATLPKLSADQARMFLCFIYNDSDYEDVDLSNNEYYQLLTGNYSSFHSVGELKAKIWSFSTFARAMMNQQAKDSSYAVDYLSDSLCKHLQSELNGMSNLNDEIIAEYGKRTEQYLKEGITDLLVSNLAKHTGIVVTGSELESVQLGLNTYADIINIPNKVETFSNRMVAAVQGVLYVRSLELTGRAMYFNCYLSNRSHYASPDDFAFQYLMEYNAFAIENNTYMSHAIDLIGWFTGKDSWSNHIDLINSWAEFLYQLEQSVTAQTSENKPNTTPTASFTDVPSGQFYTDAVAWAVKNGITVGTSDTTFSPNDICTREQIVTFLWRANGSPDPKRTSNPFTDIKPTDFSYKAVLWAAENGITYGMGVNSFGPKIGCSRAEVVTFLWRANGEPNAVASTTFTDISSHAYYTDAVAWAVNTGVTYGTSNTTFSPDNTCSRGEIVTFLYRDMA